MAGQLLNGNKLRTFNVMDEWGVEGRNITVDSLIHAPCVLLELDKPEGWKRGVDRTRDGGSCGSQWHPI